MTNDNFPYLFNMLVAFITILPWIVGIISYHYRSYKRQDIKKLLNLITGVGLILTSFSMISYTVYSQSQLYSATGFIPPLMTPSLTGLTFVQDQIFGNFSNFFYLTLSIGIFGLILGMFRLNKYFSFGNNIPPIYQ